MVSHSPSKHSRSTRNNVLEVRSERQANPPPPIAPSSSTALSRKIVSCSSAVATAGREGVDSAFPVRTRGSRYKILLNRTHLHTGARASRAERREGPAAARAPGASIVLLRGEAPRRGKRGGQRETGAGTAYYGLRHINKRLLDGGCGEGGVAGWERRKG